MKIVNDKYYTSKELAKYCINKTYEIIGEENISEVIEPSAGSGNFSLQVPTICWAYDTEPEHESIIKADFLEQDIIYLWGRLIIGNPPYGRCLNLAQKFFKKSIQLGDYVAFILPISQLNNTQSFYEFDLIHSEDLGMQVYTDRELHCCFNIYQRPKSDELNKRPSNKLKDITIIRQDSKGYEEKDFDIRMCYWGDGSAGKILKDGEHYSGEYKIQIHNEKLKDKIIDVITNYDWKKYIDRIAMRRIKQYHIINVLKENIPEIN